MHCITGMLIWPIRFRWVVCQIEALRKCLKLSVLRQTLQTLPQTLDGTYDRILLNIPRDYAREAYTALQFLTVARCSVSVADVAEAVAVNQETHTFDPNDRLTDPFDVIEILSSLVTYSSDQILLRSSQTPRYGSFPGAERATEIRLAHYSVKEYLLSDRIRSGKASAFNMPGYEAHTSVAELCLTYLISFDQPDFVSAELLLDYPFGLYAAQFWYQHAQISYSCSESEDEATNLTRLGIRLLSPAQSSSYINWLRLCDPCEPWRGVDDGRDLKSTGSPLFYACCTGLLEVARALLDQGADINSCNPCRRLMTMTPLNGAIFGGHFHLVKFLLESGVNVNAIDDWERTPLHHAALYGDMLVVELLLRFGACLESKTGPITPHCSVDAPHDIPLQSFMSRNTTGRTMREEIVIALTQHIFKKQMHLESIHFAISPTDQWPIYGNNNVLVKTLMYGGDKHEIRDATGWTPLHEASWGGHSIVTAVLLRNGADIECKTRYGWTSLLFAVWKGHTSVVAELVRWGANVKVRNAYGWQPLHAAWKESIICLLLDNGADIEAETSYGWTPLFGSSSFDDQMLELLIQRGADLDAYNVYGGTALHIAARAGNARCVRLLLQHGADRSMKSAFGTTAYEEAARQGHDNVVQLFRSTSHRALPPESGQQRPASRLDPQSLPLLDALPSVRFAGTSTDALILVIRYCLDNRSPSP